MSASVFPVPLSGIQEGLIAAKGDLIVGLGNDNPGILTAGTTGQTLIVDSSTASGLKWAAPSTPAFVGCSVYANATSISFTNGVEAKITYSAEDFDTDGFHSTSTNTSRITIPSGKAGKYLFNVMIRPTDATPEYAILYLTKNGSGVNGITSELVRHRSIASNSFCLNGSIIYDAAVSDYFEVGLQCDWTTGNKTISSRFTATYLGA